MAAAAHPPLLHFGGRACPAQFSFLSSIPRLGGAIDRIHVDARRPDLYSLALRIEAGGCAHRVYLFVSGVDLESRLAVSPVRPAYAVAVRKIAYVIVKGPTAWWLRTISGSALCSTRHLYALLTDTHQSIQSFRSGNRRSVTCSSWVRQICRFHDEQTSDLTLCEASAIGWCTFDAHIISWSMSGDEFVRISGAPAARPEGSAELAQSAAPRAVHSWPDARGRRRLPGPTRALSTVWTLRRATASGAPPGVLPARRICARNLCAFMSLCAIRSTSAAPLASPGDHGRRWWGNVRYSSNAYAIPGARLSRVTILSLAYLRQAPVAVARESHCNGITLSSPQAEIRSQDPQCSIRLRPVRGSTFLPNYGLLWQPAAGIVFSFGRGRLVRAVFLRSLASST
ncbi:hypothetical protein E0198_004776 [Clavispora lusitaniae]|nr:hypothetical protein E0198_004776 [Clavispora lusitaniae]